MVQRFPRTEPWSYIARLGLFGFVSCMLLRPASWKELKEPDSHFGRLGATSLPTSLKVNSTRFPKPETASAGCVVFPMIYGEGVIGPPAARSCLARVRAAFTKSINKPENLGKSSSQKRGRIGYIGRACFPTAKN